MPDEPERPNWVARIATVIWQPSLVFMPFLIMGIVLWLCPSMEGASGYIVREEITFSNLGILTCWYACICICAWIGQRLALEIPRLTIMSQDAIEPRTFYLALSALA
ncbi:MAG: hypothetical protein ACF787_01580, partial [Rhodopirellula sp. JB053]